jgi:NADH:ubiquinone oxidoreductase subunit 4 (subunit M)
MNYQHVSSIIMLLKGKNINLGTYFQVGVTFSLEELFMKLPYNAHEHVYFNMVLSKSLYHVCHIPKFTLKWCDTYLKKT